MLNIEISDLVGNAFFSYLSKTGKHVLSMKKINNFGHSVINSLKADGVDACLLLSRNRTYSFFNEYSDYFTFLKSDNLVVLNNSISAQQLADEFSGYLPLPVLIALRAPNNIKILFE